MIIEETDLECPQCRKHSVVRLNVEGVIDSQGRIAHPPSTWHECRGCHWRIQVK